MRVCLNIFVELRGKAHNAQVIWEISLVLCNVVIIDACQEGGDDIGVGQIEYRVQEHSAAAAVVVDKPFLCL
jgi:hypothetical protein